MSRRAWVVVGAVAAVILAASAAAYLTGFVIIGDPFSGVWSTDPAAALSPEGTWIAEGPNASSGLLIKQTSSGYVYTGLLGTTMITGWQPLERHGRVLDNKVRRFSAEYQPWSGHLVVTDGSGGRVIGPLILRKVTDSTSVPSQTN